MDLKRRVGRPTGDGRSTTSARGQTRKQTLGTGSQQNRYYDNWLASYRPLDVLEPGSRKNREKIAADRAGNYASDRNVVPMRAAPCHYCGPLYLYLTTNRVLKLLLLFIT